jgi:hypothetical protein
VRRDIFASAILDLLLHGFDVCVIRIKSEGFLQVLPGANAVIIVEIGAGKNQVRFYALLLA